MNNSNFDFRGNPKKSTPEGSGFIKIRLTLLDIVIMLVSLVAFTVIGFLDPLSAALATLMLAPFFAAETRRIGGLFPVIIPAVSAVSAILLALTAGSSLISLVNIPFAAVCSYIIAASSTRHSDTFRTSAITGVTVASVIWILTIFALTLASLDMRAEHFVRLVSEEYDASTIPALTEMLTVALSEVYTPEECANFARLYVFSMKIILPAYICLIVMACGYISVTLYKLFVKIFGAGSTLSGVNFALTMSKVSAAAYLIVTLLSVFLQGPAAYGMQNVTSILTPGFFILGLRAVREFLAKKRISGTGGKVLAALIAIVAISLGNLATSIVVVFGLNYTLNPKYSFVQKGGGKDR